MSVHGRRSLSRMAAVGLAFTLLAGCGGSEERTSGESVTEEQPSAGAATGIPGVLVGGPPGSAVVVIDTPLEVTDPASAVVGQGDGRALRDGGPALLSVAAWDGTTGVSSSGGVEIEPRLVTVTPDAVGETLAELLPGVREGSRVVVAEPVDVEGELTMQVVVVDVLPTVAVAQEGPGGESPTDEAESPTDRPGSPSVGPGPEAGLPTVGAGSDGTPVVGVPPDEPPTELVSRVVVSGGGATVLPGQDLVLQYLSLDWDTGEVLSSSWADGAPSSVPVDDLAEGVRLALLDRRVGSRVLAVVPPGLGDGERTLVVVVDILAATGGDEDVVR